MRLIDADKIPNYEIKYVIDRHETEKLQKAELVSRIAFWEDIENAPTVDVLGLINQILNTPKEALSKDIREKIYKEKRE